MKKREVGKKWKDLKVGDSFLVWNREDNEIRKYTTVSCVTAKTNRQANLIVAEEEATGFRIEYYATKSFLVNGYDLSPSWESCEFLAFETKKDFLLFRKTELRENLEETLNSLIKVETELGILRKEEYEKEYERTYSVSSNFGNTTETVS